MVAKLALPAFFIPVQIVGVTLAGLSLFGLNSRLGSTIVDALPALTSAAAGWVCLCCGAIVIVVNGCRFQWAHGGTGTRSNPPLSIVGRPSLAAALPSGESGQTGSVSLLPPGKNRMAAVLFGALSVMFFAGIGYATFSVAFGEADPVWGLAAFGVVVVACALALVLIAASWLSARVVLGVDGTIDFRGLFVRRRYAISEIVSVRLNAHRGRQFVVIRTIGSRFSISEYSFSSTQLDAVKAFCDPRGVLTSIGL